MTPENQAHPHLVELQAALLEKERQQRVEPVKVEPSGPDVSFVEADRDHEADALDAVAGSEFVDDQIRLE